MKNYTTMANGALSLPNDVYKVTGNVVEVYRPQRELGDVLEVGPLGKDLTPHWGQKPIWHDRQTRNQILLAGSQGGKSHIGPHWLWREIEEKVNNGPPGTEYLFGIVGPTLQMMRQATVGIARMVRFICAKFDCSEDLILNKQDLRIDLRPLGYRVHIYAGSAERRHRLQGARLEAAWIDEGGQVRDPAIYNITIQRLHGSGRLLVTTTPYLAGAAWLAETIKRAESGEDPDTMVVRFPSIVNPYFSLEEEEALKKQLPPWYFNMMYNAEFEKPQGLVYPNVTYIEPFEIPSQWPRVIGIDPTHGGRDKFAAVWITYDPWEPETWYIYREFYLSCTPDITSVDQRWRSPHEMLDAIYAMSMVEKWDEERKEFVATDERETITRIFVDPSKKETLYDVQNRFTETQVYSADAKLAGLIEVGSVLKTGRLVVFNNLINWAFEQSMYSYPFDEFGEAIGEVPMDRHNHLMDSTRYAVRQSDSSRMLADPSFA